MEIEISKLPLLSFLPLSIWCKSFHSLFPHKHRIQSTPNHVKLEIQNLLYKLHLPISIWSQSFPPLHPQKRRIESTLSHISCLIAISSLRCLKYSVVNNWIEIDQIQISSVYPIITEYFKHLKNLL